MRHALVLALALLVLPAVVPSVPAAEAEAASSDVVAGRYALVVHGETALGWLAYPATTTPTTLLVFGHGCCGKPNQSAAMESYARSYGVAAVAMDYRGPGGWDVWKGHEDLIAATEDLQARFPIARTVIWGISMGGETTGMAVAARPDLYDYWVDTFGVTNLFEEFAALGHYPRAPGYVNPNDPSNPTGSAIVRETGGTPATVPEEYAKRSPALRTAEMVGITRAYILHGVGDPIVPYSMSRETFEGLRANGVPVSLHTYLSGSGGTQLPWGAPYPPACVAQPGVPDVLPPSCVPVPRCVASPAGGCVPYPPWGPVGPAAHDGRGAGHSAWIVDQLLRGLEPDAGTAWREHVHDHTSNQHIAVPPP